MVRQDTSSILIALLCGRGSSAQEAAAVPKEAWPAVIQEALAQRCAGLLSRRVMQDGALRASLPAASFEALQTVAASLTARNLFLADELQRLLRACRANAVDAIPLRGLVLAECLHGDPTVRPMGDLDLLIRNPDLPAMARLLEARGYQAVDRRKGFAQSFSYTAEFFRQAPIPLVVEPHWSLAYPPFTRRLDMEAVWRRCVPMQFLGIDTQMLCREDCLLNLCLHMAHHGTAAPLLWMIEMDQFLRTEGSGFDWALFLETVQEAGVGRLVSAALRRTQDRCDTPIPSRVSDELARGDRIARTLVESVEIPGMESLAGWLALKGWRAKWRYAGGLLFPSPAFMRLHYGLSNRRQLVCWYVKRPAQLGLHALKGFLQLFRGSVTPWMSAKRPS